MHGTSFRFGRHEILSSSTHLISFPTRLSALHQKHKDANPPVEHPLACNRRIRRDVLFCPCPHPSGSTHLARRTHPSGTPLPTWTISATSCGMGSVECAVQSGQIGRAHV